MEAGSSITYANEVVAIIAGVAASEVEGIAGMVNVPNGNLLGKNRSVTKGVKVETGTEEASVDLYVTVEYGKPIQKAAQDAQESVRRAIEAMTGLHVVRVDVHVQGVSFEKENSALSAGAQNAVLEAGTEAAEEAAAEDVAEQTIEAGEADEAN
ncbi:MAG: Asp23/Gls24 family envelope stress response protein [Clostridia bacterium]|nr:Asp23/Gls24 family envelope stress response protein [Clostridia bacterium]